MAFFRLSNLQLYTSKNLTKSCEVSYQLQPRLESWTYAHSNPIPPALRLKGTWKLWRVARHVQRDCMSGTTYLYRMHKIPFGNLSHHFYLFLNKVEEITIMCLTLINTVHSGRQEGVITTQTSKKMRALY